MIPLEFIACMMFEFGEPRDFMLFLATHESLFGVGLCTSRFKVLRVFVSVP